MAGAQKSAMSYNLMAVIQQNEPKINQNDKIFGDSVMNIKNAGHLTIVETCDRILCTKV